MGGIGSGRKKQETTYCSVDGCTNISRARTFCWKHLRRYYRYNSIELPIKFPKSIAPKLPKPTLEYKFWSKVDKRGPDDCWVWMASRLPFGYGQIVINGKHKLAHRISYKLLIGEIPDDMLVCHHCDNPPCVNPKHLFIGTDKDNVRDAIKKGRLTCDLRKNLKLTRHRAMIARQLRTIGGCSIDELAKVFHVHPEHMRKICNGKAWR